jgi:polysaccharide biosynthesis/export protein
VCFCKQLSTSCHIEAGQFFKKYFLQACPIQISQMINFSNQNKHSVFTGLFSMCICLSAIFFFSSCTVTRPTSYFRDLKKDTLLTVLPKQTEELKIKAGDILAIKFSSLSPEEDQLYNRVDINYEVSKEGNIHLHRMAPYLKDALVTISFANHFITIMGDIGAPKVLPMPEERISIIEALAQGGSVTETMLLSDVIIIRDSSYTQKQIKHINLEGEDVFASNYFYLQPNDVLVLQPDEKTIVADKKRLKYQQVTGLFIGAATFILLIYQTFFRN